MAMYSCVGNVYNIFHVIFAAAKMKHHLSLFLIIIIIIKSYVSFLCSGFLVISSRITQILLLVSS